jgi:formylglycine-generating enzyme required for sulfatase activity
VAIRPTASPTAKREPQPGEERRVAIPGGLEMVFCWIPPGTCQLGSPKAERDCLDPGGIKDFIAHEGEDHRGVYTTTGFWLGKYPVTQAEWRAVTDESPSYFQAGAGGADAVKGLDTTQFPVENVSWDMCQEFLKRMNREAGVVFGLPHEDQWEYACRGGRGNRQPFYWGCELNGTQANVNGNYPYPFGTAAKGPHLKRPCPVDFTNGGRYPAHPWGLLHMHGNVQGYRTTQVL